MSHEITERADSKVEMAYRGETPWLGLGNELRDDMTLDERVAAAGFDWEICNADCEFTIKNGKGLKRQKMPEKQVLYRSDNGMPLSVVSGKFHVVQPRTVLEYFDNLTQKFGVGTLETAGTLYGGKQFWGLATVGETASVVLDPKDKVRMRILFASSCDRSLASTVKFVCERVVCHNTLDVALREGGAQHKIRHRTVFDPGVVNAALGIKAKEEFGEQLDLLRKLARTAMSDVEVVKATAALYLPFAPVGKRMRGRPAPIEEISEEDLTALLKTKQVGKVSQLAIGHEAMGANLKGVHGTLWGWLNGVTQYIDWDNGAKTADRRLSRAWTGAKGAGLKSMALDMAAKAVAGNDRVFQKKWALDDQTILETVLGE